jgi:hypothetical protein
MDLPGRLPAAPMSEASNIAEQHSEYLLLG